MAFDPRAALLACVAQPDPDIAEAALWLASDSSTFVNGQAIAVDGGLTTGPLYRQAPAQIDGLMQILQAPAS